MIPARPDQESVVHLCLLLTEKHAPVMILRTTIHHPTIPDGFLKVFPSLSSRAASTTNMQKPSVAMIHVRPQSMSQFHIIFGNIYHYVNIITPSALQFQIKVWQFTLCPVTKMASSDSSWFLCFFAGCTFRCDTKGDCVRGCTLHCAICPRIFSTAHLEAPPLLLVVNINDDPRSLLVGLLIGKTSQELRMLSSVTLNS